MLSMGMFAIISAMELAGFTLKAAISIHYRSVLKVGSYWFSGLSFSHTKSVLILNNINLLDNLIYSIYFY